MKRRYEILLDKVYELEGLLHLAVVRNDAPRRVLSLIKEKGRQIQKELDGLEELEETDIVEKKIASQLINFAPVDEMLEEDEVSNLEDDSKTAVESEEIKVDGDEATQILEVPFSEERTEIMEDQKTSLGAEGEKESDNVEDSAEEEDDDLADAEDYEGQEEEYVEEEMDDALDLDISIEGTGNTEGVGLKNQKIKEETEDIDENDEDSSEDYELGDEEYELEDEETEIRSMHLRIPDIHPVNINRERPVFSLNDRFLYIREYFNGDAKAFDKAINRLDRFDAYRDAENYFVDEVGVDPETDEGKAFLESIRKVF